MRKRSDIISTIFLIVLLLVGLSVMLYPTISDWWNKRVQSRAIATYNEAVSKLDTETYERLLAEADEYNRKLASLPSPFTGYKDISGYDDILNISGTGIMGYISIPNIKAEFPIYHGTSPEVLNVAAGHLEGTSLPVGGKNTHSVISAHRGLPSARLFTDLDKLEIGDIFTITILDKVLTYEIDDISIVLPEDTQKLAIISGCDYVTLMTCTPYGINTHRLLLRSHRIETLQEQQSSDVGVMADASKVDPMLIVPLISVPLLILLFIFWSVTGKRSAYDKKVHSELEKRRSLRKGDD